MSEVTWNAIIDLNQTLLTHKSQFNPIFAARRENGHAVLLRVDSLPDQLVGVDITDVAVLGQLELRCDPLCVRRQAEAQVQAVLDGDAQHLWFI